MSGGSLELARPGGQSRILWLAMRDGSFTLRGSLSVARSLAWRGGAFFGGTSGPLLNIERGALATLDGETTKVLGTDLANSGAIEWQAGWVIFRGQPDGAPRLFNGPSGRFSIGPTAGFAYAGQSGSAIVNAGMLTVDNDGQAQ